MTWTVLQVVWQTDGRTKNGHNQGVRDKIKGLSANVEPCLKKCDKRTRKDKLGDRGTNIPNGWGQGSVIAPFRIRNYSVSNLNQHTLTWLDVELYGGGGLHAHHGAGVVARVPRLGPLHLQLARRTVRHQVRLHTKQCSVTGLQLWRTETERDKRTDQLVYLAMYLEF